MVLKDKWLIMTKIEFNKNTYNVLKCGTSGMYSIDKEHMKIALNMMKEGVFFKSPKKEWGMSGWKATKKGEKLFEKFKKQLLESHGHVWKTNKDSYPEEDGEYGDMIDEFALSEGIHNGPECKICGYSFCMHCTDEFDIPKCKGKKTIRISTPFFKKR